MFFQPGGNHALGQPGGVYGRVKLLDHVGQRSYVVFVAVGDYYATDPGGIFDKVGDVRDNQVYAWQVLSWKLDAGIDDENVLAVLQRQHVLADLTYSAEGDDFERWSGHMGILKHRQLLWSVLFFWNLVGLG